MSELNELYQSVLLEHAENPKNFGTLSDCDRSAKGFNPICGDKVEVFLKLKDGCVAQVRFNGSGCAICMASASIMSELASGKKESEVKSIFSKFHSWMVNGDYADEIEALGEVAALAGVRRFPIRIKCATLAWHALHNALDADNKVATTE